VLEVVEDQQAQHLPDQQPDDHARGDLPRHVDGEPLQRP
jgi:hypothetical protein